MSDQHIFTPWATWLHGYMGYMGPKLDYLAKSLIQHFTEKYPNKSPRKILEMGCSAGNSAAAWKEAFPGAEVYAIDVGEGLLRYAHARAEVIRTPVHFSQQNAETTNFADESFDVIVSHIMMHETSTAAVARIFSESRRLLKPGCVMLHMDLPRLDEMSPIDSFLNAWEVYNNNETFGGTYRTMDVLAEAKKTGFSKERTVIDQVKFI